MNRWIAGILMALAALVIAEGVGLAYLIRKMPPETRVATTPALIDDAILDQALDDTFNGANTAPLAVAPKNPEADDDFMKRLIAETIDALAKDPADANQNASSDAKKGKNGKTDAERKEAKKKKAEAEGNAAGKRDRDKTEAAAKSKQLAHKAHVALKNGDYEGAAKLLEESIAADPQNREAYKSLAQIQRQLGLSDAEMQTYQDWMKAMPKDALPHYMLSGIYQKEGLYSEAYNELKQFEQMSDGKLSSYPMTASMYRQLGMRAEEGSALQNWTGAAPESSDAHHALADYYRRTGNYQASIAEYQTVEALAPGTVSAYVNLGGLYQRMGQYAAAETQYQAALELRPEDVSLRGQLAESYRRQGDYGSAINMYQSIIDLAPETPAARQANRVIIRLENQMNRPR